ncbi:dihydrolipoamide acetyltransferase family protein [Burkholderia perseverans]|uniref:dihydrolipoamide acetyltransferase family protein n=1 Tax=Burkholderia perseverans TaxID=2615214 RepID=UPI001FEF7647|nr:dihydrolipoamide acetyltransferase family protein [Burkholderia perseverans]
MGIHVIKMPDIGEGIAEVELGLWHVKVGDLVKEDQALADVMTDKASVEIPSPVAGVVAALGGSAGDMMAVGAELIRIEVDGSGNHRGEAAVAANEAKQAAPAAVREAVQEPKHEPVREPVQEATREPAREAAHAQATLAPVAGRGERAAANAVAALPVAREPGERPLASPAVRKRAWDLGIELRFVRGTGEAARILHEDLDAYLQGRGGMSGGGAPAARSGYAERHDEEAVQVIGLRRRIAEKMQESKRRIPHFSYVEEIDVTELDTLRAELNRRHGETRGKLTMLPFIARAMVIALADFPQINARYDDEAGVVTRHGAVHLGVATQSKAGLMVPVVRHAETRDVWALAAEVARLAEAVRSGRAARDELSGSTITLSSLGALGGVVSTPVINHPEVGIVGVNRIVERPMIRHGLVVARKLMNLSSSFDHRVVDGMDAAEFIQAVRALLEQPALLFVD